MDNNRDVRADRLVAVLLILQRRGQVTAAEVARELEVSERTARRDLDALGAAGLPVYAVQGRGGGWRLLGGGRTDLSGLSSGEVRALFMVAGPHAETTPEIRAALRKLLRALPEPFQDEASAAASSTFTDTTPWQDTSGNRPPPPLLPAVQDAVIVGDELMLDYVDRTGTATQRPIAPLGVVSKGSIWYLIADTEAGQRTFRVDRIRSVEATGRHAPRPADFDLGATWAEVMAGMEEMWAPLEARGVVAPRVLSVLRHVLGQRVAIGRPNDDGWVEVVIRGRSPEILAAEIAGFGSDILIDSPPALRAELARIGASLTATYSLDGSDQGATGAAGSSNPIPATD